MTTHDEKILQLLDRIHHTAQSRREKTVDDGVQHMERVNRTSYGALRELTENGHKNVRRGVAQQTWQPHAQELLVNDDATVNAPKPAVARMAPQVAAAVVEDAGVEVTMTDITQVMHDGQEATQVTTAPVAPQGFDAPAAVAPVARDDREHAPDQIIAGDGATYGGGSSAYQQTQVIWFRRLFRRR